MQAQSSKLPDWDLKCEPGSDVIAFLLGAHLPDSFAGLAKRRDGGRAPNILCWGLRIRNPIQVVFLFLPNGTLKGVLCSKFVNCRSCFRLRTQAWLCGVARVNCRIGSFMPKGYPTVPRCTRRTAGVIFFRANKAPLNNLQC